MNKQIVKAVVTSALLGHAAIAWADTAEAAYRRGKAALKAGHVHEACGELDASDKLEAKVETELNLAACYAEDGKPVSAARLYRAVAAKDDIGDRKKTAIDKATKLEAKAPKLRLTLSQRPAGLAIMVDGAPAPLSGDIPVDAGPHEVVATAPGFEGHASAAVDKDRAVVDVIVRMEPKAEPIAPTPTLTPVGPTPAVTVMPDATPAPMPMQTLEMQPSHDHRKRNGAVLGAVGIGALVTSVIFFEAGQAKFDQEHALCPNATCRTTPEVNFYNQLRGDARDDRAWTIGMGIGGVALVGVGVYLLVSPHTEEPRMSVTVGHGNAELTYTSHF